MRGCGVMRCGVMRGCGAGVWGDAGVWGIVM